MSDFDGHGVAQAAQKLSRGSRNWRHIVKHTAAVQSLYLGALRGFTAYNQAFIGCETGTHSELTGCLNALEPRLFPIIHWTCIQVIRRDKGTDPMFPHNHKNDESTLSAIGFFGEFSSGEFSVRGSSPVATSHHHCAPSLKGSRCTALRWTQGEG